MESIPEMKENILTQESINNSMNQICLSKNFYRSFNDYENSNISKDSQETIYPEEDSKNIIMINIQNDEKPKKRYKINKYPNLNEIEQMFSFYNEEEFFEQNIELNLSSIGEDKSDISNISNIDVLCENEMRNIFMKLNKFNNDFFSNKYFRLYLINDNNKNDGVLDYIYCIPKVKYEKGDIIFIYSNEKIKLEIETLLNLILNDKMFINPNEKEILKQAYFCQNHNQKFIKYCHCNNDICGDCWKDHFLHEGIDLKKKDINKNDIKILQKKINYLKDKYKNIKNNISRLIDSYWDLKKNTKYNYEFKNIIKKDINNKFNRNKQLLSFSIYNILHDNL